MSLKTALRQLIILAQALVIVVGGYSAMTVIAASVREHHSIAYLPPFRTSMSGSGIAAYVLLYALPQLVFIAAVVLAAFWWLSQQRALAETLDSYTLFSIADIRAFCIRRWKLVTVGAIIVIAGLVLLLELQNFSL